MLKKIVEKALQVLSSPKKYLIGIAGVLILLISLKLFFFSLSDKYNDTTLKEYFNSNYKFFSIRIPKSLNFSGEKVPISKLDIQKAMEYELYKNTYSQSQTIILHRRVHRWFPIIEPILKKHNIPDDFKYLALVESKLTNAVSPKGATGFWQILEGTGKEYGMEINNEVDERYDVAKSTKVACKYLLDSYKVLKNWTLVAASYNYGISGIKRELKKQQVDNYYDLDLTEETAQYVYRILAMKEIISRPKIYGFSIEEKDHKVSAIPTRIIKVDTVVNDLASFAEMQGINYAILQLFNPWIRSNTLNQIDSVHLSINPLQSKLKKYSLKLPVSKTEIYKVDTVGGCEVTLIKSNDTIKGKKENTNYHDSLKLDNCQIENVTVSKK